MKHNIDRTALLDYLHLKMVYYRKLRAAYCEKGDYESAFYCLGQYDAYKLMWNKYCEEGEKR